MSVGVLALQGDFERHRQALARHGIASHEVRVPRDLATAHALVLPGGESTTMLRLLRVQELYEPLEQALRSGMPVLATCAGVVLCATHVTEPEQPSFGVLDIDVARNGYGRQIASGTYPLASGTLPAGTTGIFIRAPRITRAGPDVEVLATRDDDPALVRQGPVIGAVFHPELDDDHVVYRLFAEQVGGRSPCQREIGVEGGIA